MQLYKANFAVLAQPGIAERLPELPTDYEQRLIRNDFAWASENRDKVLAEWRKRYDGKSEPVAK
jgi:iron(III) transport system substrate-binding protein